MHRSVFYLQIGSLFCWFGWMAAPIHAQQSTLHARANLVLVPTLVETKAGEPVFNLTAKDFVVTDNGVEQKIRLDTETDKAPISMVVVVQTGRSAVREFHNYQGLATMLQAVAGDTLHQIAVVAFDSRPRTLLDFSGNSAAIADAIGSLRPGDGGAAILDSVWYAVDMLADEPPQNQRVVFLLSETRDHGSRTPIAQVIQKIGRSDAVVYSLTFSASRSDLMEGLKNPAWSGSANLLAPLMMTIQAFRKNAAASIPNMTGGQYLRFNQGKQLDRELGTLANQVHNRYMLSFQPANPAPGLHILSVRLKQSLDVRVRARTSYWAANQSDLRHAEPPSSGSSMAPKLPRD